MAAAAWGPLEPLRALLESDDAVADAEKDRRTADAALQRALAAEDTAAALQQASIEQVDAALAHDALAVERKPLAALTLLAVKAQKVERWMALCRRAEDPAWRRIAAAFVAQSALLFHELPVHIAMKELRRVSLVAAQYTSLANDLQQSLRAVFPLKSLLRRVGQHGHTAITPLHAHFFYLCLRAKCYSAATDVLNRPLFEVHAQQGLVTPVDVLGYAYYGGLLCLGQKRYQDATDFFLLAVTAPAVALSAFVVEAYKKLLLTSLILRGESPSLPKYTPYVVTRNIETHCAAYLELRRAFVVDKDVQSLVNVLEAHASVFAKDGNTGLVKQAIEAFKQQKLLQLPRTYVTIALSEISKVASLSAASTAADEVDAERLLLQLIDRGAMAAAIDKEKRMVKFVLDDDDDDDEREGELEQMLAMERLQREMEKILAVSAKLRAMDAEIVTSAKFQSRLAKDKERRHRGGGHQGGDERGADAGAPGFGLGYGLDSME
ncbi:hypothetical protein P43SY_007384 [Pythium insidiosum]|uniref:COP9 signalosome complex subunit 3 n=1 Tax=Pythium insidiosum TaxID=114742 RepID=A0AAD5LTP3_PYTIN|nr:hypothetical protein P43SY_007384 [Pythium insidiosum]